jgi:hypothetical protein
LTDIAYSAALPASNVAPVIMVSDFLFIIVHATLRIGSRRPHARPANEKRAIPMPVQATALSVSGLQVLTNGGASLRRRKS